MSDVVKPRKKELPPGDEFGFRARLKETPATARRLEITFTASPEMSMEGKKDGTSKLATNGEKPDPAKKE